MAGATALVIVVLAILLSLTQRSRAHPAAVVQGGQEVSSRLAGIPQHGLELGNPNAPVTLEEFTDLQCPGCAAYTQQVFPILVDRYVRPGKLRLVFRGQAFVGTDSERLLRLALAAARQNRLWHFVELAYLNQGAENSGWATDEMLRALATVVPELDVDRAWTERESRWVSTQMLQAATAFEMTPLRPEGYRATPTFMVGRTGATLEPLFSFDPNAFDGAIAPLLD
jgi:protein-disulfide isomerase